jgi:predicted alpha/beta hydrolase family esterase
LGNRRPRDHWQWWLAEELRNRGEQVLYPQFPDPDEPNLVEWLDLLVAELGQLGDAERVVVCHSLGCALWYQASLRNVIPRPVDRLLLVAPPGPSVLSRRVTVAFYPGIWAAAVLASSCRARIRLVASDVDPFCAEGPAAEVYGRPLGLDCETLPGTGHLSVADGMGPWPAVLRWCLNGDARLACER